MHNRAKLIQIDVAGGIETQLDTHTAAAIDAAGRMLAHQTFVTSKPGYVQLLAWLRSFGGLVVVGVEDTGAHGSGVARYLTSQGVRMVEVDRPDRKAWRAARKSDPLDAEAAARAALGRVRTGVPKDHTGHVEALRNLRVARRSAIAQRADCIRRIKALLVTAPDPFREQLRALPDVQLLRVCVAMRPDTGRVAEPKQAVKVALRSLGRRHHGLCEEIVALDALIEPLVRSINSALLELNGAGADVAGQLLVTAGQHTERLHSEAAFAMLCGIAPIPASSGKTHRHRLNRGGDRQANAALHRIVICRLRWDERTQAYMKRRTAEGLSKKDIICCLKRLITHEIYFVLRSSETTAANHALAA